MSDILPRVGVDAKPDKLFENITTREAIRRWWESYVTYDVQGA
jgi:uncharacterized protein YndB with AHSA1/START domain